MSLEQRLEEVRLLHRSETLAAVFKPSGLLVHNSAWAGPREPSLAERVRALLDQEAHPLGRLDRGTSGVVWFALDRSHYAAQHEALALPSATGASLAAVVAQGPAKVRCCPRGDGGLALGEPRRLDSALPALVLKPHARRELGVR